MSGIMKDMLLKTRYEFSSRDKSELFTRNCFL